MIRLILFFLLIPSLLFAGQGMGPGPGFKKYTGGGGYMTPAYVNSNSGYTSGPATLSGVTAGNALIVGVSDITTLASATVSGGCAASWQSVTQGACGTLAKTYTRFFYCENATGGSASVTLGSLGSDPGWSIHEYSGIAQSSSIISSPYVCNPNSILGSYSTANMTFSQPGVIVTINADEQSDIFTSWGASQNARTVQATHVHRTSDRIISSNADYASSVTTTDCSPYCDVDMLQSIALKARSN